MSTIGSQSTFLSTLWKSISWTLRIGCGVHVLHTYVYEISETQGESMIPTLNYSGDYAHTNKLCARGKGVGVGDIIVAVKPTDPSQRVCKRITGMAGDIIQVDPSRAYQRASLKSVLSQEKKKKGSENMQSIDVVEEEEEDGIQDWDMSNIDIGSMEMYQSRISNKSKRQNKNPDNDNEQKDEDDDDESVFIKVPEGHCWVTGDNLSRSLDSRSYGVLPLGLIKGKIFAVTTREGNAVMLHNNLESK